MIETILIARLFSGGGCGEDEVRVARRLVNVEVHCDEKVELCKRGFKLRGVRSAAQRVGHQQDHRPYLTVTWSEYLLGHGGGREHPYVTGWPLTRLFQRPKSKPLPFERAAQRRGGGCKHNAPRAIEIAGEDVHEVDSPARQGAELLHARAQSSVTGGGLRGGQLASEATDRGG